MKLINKKGFSQNQFQSRMAAQRPCRQHGSLEFENPGGNKNMLKLCH